MPLPRSCHGRRLQKRNHSRLVNQTLGDGSHRPLIPQRLTQVAGGPPLDHPRATVSPKKACQNWPPVQRRTAHAHATAIATGTPPLRAASSKWIGTESRRVIQAVHSLADRSTRRRATTAVELGAAGGEGSDMMHLGKVSTKASEGGRVSTELGSALQCQVKKTLAVSSESVKGRKQSALSSTSVKGR